MQQGIITKNKKQSRRKPVRATSSAIIPQPQSITVDLRPYSVGGRFAPDRVIVKCRYNDTNNGQFTQSGQTYCSKRWRLNSAFDPDPALGSGSVAGFSEWAALYNKYLITAVEYDIWLANKETSNPVQMIVAPTITDVGVNYSSIDELQEVPFGRNALTSVAGGFDHVRLRGRIPLGALQGDPVKWQADPQYSAATTGNPSTMYYLNFGGFMLGGTFTSLGIACSARLTYEIEFYERKSLFA